MLTSKVCIALWPQAGQDRKAGDEAKMEMRAWDGGEVVSWGLWESNVGGIIGGPYNVGCRQGYQGVSVNRVPWGWGQCGAKALLRSLLSLRVPK